MNKKVVLGLDTSNYTTSMSLMSLDGELVYDTRKLLPVDHGKRGLRQSEALFHHIQQLPYLSDEISRNSDKFHIVAISASTKPRPVEDSYMPVFLAAKSYGDMTSNLFNIPFYEFSHQEGHIEAALWSENIHMKEEFIAIHISGGTTEVLAVRPRDIGYDIEIIGGTSDLSAGQFIDRIGVAMGLEFPSGRSLEEISKSCLELSLNVPVSVTKNKISFSGPETHFSRLMKETNISKADIAYGTFYCVARSLELLVKNIGKQYAIKNLLIVGGVASNNQIRSYLQEKLTHEDIHLYFAAPKYCTDNSVGISSLGVSKYRKQNNFCKERLTESCK